VYRVFPLEKKQQEVRIGLLRGKCREIRVANFGDETRVGPYRQVRQAVIVVLHIVMCFPKEDPFRPRELAVAEGFEPLLATWSGG
jgi:hypothetical protein